MDEKTRKIITGILIIAVLLVGVFLAHKEQKNNKESINLTRTIARVGVFAAISTILYTVPFLKFSLPIFPSFLEIHFDEIPAFICGFAYGPLSGVLVIVIKTLIKLPISSTAGVGELSDLLYSIAFILPATLIYKHNRNFQGVFAGLAAGTLCQIVISILGNVFVMIPFYLYVSEFKLTEATLLKLMQKANPYITDIRWGYGLFAVLPFNALKDALVIVITLLVYKPLRKVIEKLANRNIEAEAL